MDFLPEKVYTIRSKEDIMRRRKDRIGKRKRHQKRQWVLWVAGGLLAIGLIWPLYL